MYITHLSNLIFNYKIMEEYFFDKKSFREDLIKLDLVLNKDIFDEVLYSNISEEDFRKSLKIEIL